MSITIDREGAAQLHYAIQADLDAVCYAISCAKAGDFTALAELVGTREVTRATDIQPDFRDGDIISVNGTTTMVQGRPIPGPLPGSWAVDIAPPIHGATCVVLNEGVKLTHRRYFRAGERCQVVAEGQRRVCPGAKLWPYVVGASQGDLVSVTGDDGRTSRWPRIIVRDDLLAADWTAPEAVPCEVPNA